MSSVKLTRRQLLQAGSASAAALLLQQYLVPNLTVPEIVTAMPLVEPTAAAQGRTHVGQVTMSPDTMIP